MSSKPTAGQGGKGAGKFRMSRDLKSGKGGKGAGDELINDKKSQMAGVADYSSNRKDSGTPIDASATGSDEDQPRYQWPPQRDPNLVYGQKIRSPVHALITALPLMMLMAGFYFYYRSESEQTNSAPIQTESVQVSGIFTGLSATSGRHYLWIEAAGITKSFRLQEEQVIVLDDLVRGELVQLNAAPTVHESTTYWVVRVEQSGAVILDTSTALSDQ